MISFSALWINMISISFRVFTYTIYCAVFYFLEDTIEMTVVVLICETIAYFYTYYILKINCYWNFFRIVIYKSKKL